MLENPQNKTVSYDKWQGDQADLSLRDSLRITIDAALRLKPDGFKALMQLLEEAGCWIKRGAHISIKPPGGKRYIRLDSLGEEYTEESLRQALKGQRTHIPKIPRSNYTTSQVKRLIDVEAKLLEGKGKGYMVWAERNNIDAKAQSIIYLKENNIGSIVNAVTLVAGGILRESKVKKQQADIINPLLAKKEEISQSVHTRLAAIYDSLGDNACKRLEEIFKNQLNISIDALAQAQKVLKEEDIREEDLREKLKLADDILTRANNMLENTGILHKEAAN